MKTLQDTRWQLTLKFAIPWNTSWEKKEQKEDVKETATNQKTKKTSSKKFDYCGRTDTCRRNWANILYENKPAPNICSIFLYLFKPTEPQQPKQYSHKTLRVISLLCTVAKGFVALHCQTAPLSSFPTTKMNEFSFLRGWTPATWAPFL